MIYQAVVIIFMIGTPTPMQIDSPKTATTTTECFAQAAVLVSELVKNAPMPIISAQGFCLTVHDIKKKEKMQDPQPSKKELSSEKII